MASPVHQTAQVDQKFVARTDAESTSTELPMVALIIMPPRAAAIIASASRSRSSSRWKSTRRKSSAAANGARVLPAAMSAAPTGDGPIGRLTANAPKAMAGQTRGPMTRKATRAIPLGGQTGVTCPWTTAKLRLSRAAIQYATAMSTKRSISRASRSKVGTAGRLNIRSPRSNQVTRCPVKPDSRALPWQLPFVCRSLWQVSVNLRSCRPRRRPSSASCTASICMPGFIGWRWVFYVNLPLGLIALALIGFLLPRLARHGRVRIDWLGIALLVAGVLPILIGLTWAGLTYPWGSPQVIGAIVVGAILLIEI